MGNETLLEDRRTRVERLLASRAYQPAEADPGFLEREELRSVRLGLDYLKPEMHLRDAGVLQTIVVFGGTRICEPVVARRKRDGILEDVSANGQDDDASARLATAERLVELSRYYDIAREFGAIVGRAGAGPSDCRITLMTGGGPGIMEAANRGASDVGAKSIGLNISLPREQYPNPYISEELCLGVHYFAIRKLHFLLRARALVVFPGGYGTLDELFETLNLIQTRKIAPLPVILVGKAFWQHAIDINYLALHGVIDPQDRKLLRYCESAEEIWNAICNWHEAAGIPLVCHPEETRP